MTTFFQLRFDARSAIRDLRVATRRENQHLHASIAHTRGRMAEEIKKRGDVSIRRAGKFSERWTRAFEVQESESTRRRHRVTLGFNSSIPFAAIHEFGGVIHGKPLMWIPLRPELKDVWARDYPGELFRINRKGGNPLLFDVGDKRARYVGVRFVKLKPRFKLREIAVYVSRVQFWGSVFTGFWASRR